MYKILLLLLSIFILSSCYNKSEEIKLNIGDDTGIVKTKIEQEISKEEIIKNIFSKTYLKFTDYGMLGSKIESERELFDIIGRLELKYKDINYFKIWNELQFHNFAISYCNIDGYKNLLALLEKEKPYVRKSGLWKEIANKCLLKEEDIFTNDNYKLLKIIHNQYLAINNFEKAAQYNCNIFTDINKKKECYEMKYSLIKYNNKTCDYLKNKEEKKFCLDKLSK